MSLQICRIKSTVAYTALYIKIIPKILPIRCKQSIVFDFENKSFVPLQSVEEHCLFWA